MLSQVRQALAAIPRLERSVAKEIAPSNERVIRSEEQDQEHAGLRAELPSLGWLVKTLEKALAGIVRPVQQKVGEAI